MEPGTVLILEPDDAVRTAITVLLRQDGYHIECYADAGDLVTRLKEAEPIVVLSESTLPDMSAETVLKHCKNGAVPVIFLGHGRQVQYAVDLVRMGAHDFLEKPFPQKRLTEKVRDMAAQYRQNANNQQDIQ